MKKWLLTYKDKIYMLNVKGRNGESERYCILVSVIYNDYSKNNKKT